MDKAKLLLDVASDLRKRTDSMQAITNGIPSKEPDQPAPQPEKLCRSPCGCGGAEMSGHVLAENKLRRALKMHSRKPVAQCF
jgi:hypothetical protein